jgi:hypothetical protein
MTRLSLVTALAAAIGAGACGGSTALDTDTVTLGSLTFDVPAAWQRADTQRRGVLTAEWVPADNAGKESVTVIRTELVPAVAKAGPQALTPLLRAAQQALADVRASRVTELTTVRGMKGARIDVEFRPPGQAERYRRVHVVLVEPSGLALVHVLYTARTPSGSPSPLDVVLDTIRREEV